MVHSPSGRGRRPTDIRRRRDDTPSHLLPLYLQCIRLITQMRDIAAGPRIPGCIPDLQADCRMTPVCHPTEARPDGLKSPSGVLRADRGVSWHPWTPREASPPRNSPKPPPSGSPSHRRAADAWRHAPRDPSVGPASSSAAIAPADRASVGMTAREAGTCTYKFGMPPISLAIPAASGHDVRSGLNEGDRRGSRRRERRQPAPRTAPPSPGRSCPPAY